eukprot:764152-Hanusia_phi.AAC.2
MQFEVEKGHQMDKKLEEPECVDEEMDDYDDWSDEDDEVGNDDWKEIFLQSVEEDDQRRRAKKRNNEMSSGFVSPTSIDESAEICVFFPNEVTEAAPVEFPVCERLGAITYRCKGGTFVASMTTCCSVIHDGNHYSSIKHWLAEVCNKRIP